jgi:hypothetical protein
VEVGAEMAEIHDWLEVEQTENWANRQVEEAVRMPNWYPTIASNHHFEY